MGRARLGGLVLVAAERRALGQPHGPHVVAPLRQRPEQLQGVALRAPARREEVLRREEDPGAHRISGASASQFACLSRPSTSRHTFARRSAAPQHRARIAAVPALPATSRIPFWSTNSIPW